jgi:hypothetical protein
VTYTVENLTDLTPAQQARAWQIPDFLERQPGRRADSVDDLYERVYVAHDGDRDDPAGRISVFGQRLLPYRDPDTGGAKLLSAALVEFPTTAVMAPEVWDALFLTALAQVPTVGVYLPPECRRHVDYLSGLGFKRYADDYDSTRSLYLGHGATAGRRPAVYPISPGTNLMRTANASSALMPETEAWAAVENYSGFSGYAWLTPLLDGLLGSPTRLLSMPAGTGDVIRLLPERVLGTVEECVGVDILDRNIEFARARADRPYLDVLNMLVCAAFLEARVTGDPVPALSLLRDVCARAGRPLDDGVARDLYVELRAVAEEALTCGGIADWFALTKGIGRYVGGQDTPAPCVSLVDAIGAGGVRALATTHGNLPAPDRYAAPDAFAALRGSGAVSFEAGDMFGYRSARPFDTIFVWEAMLIVAAAGRQREYVEMIDANLAAGGTVVMTGIRRDDGRPGRDLEIVEAEFRRGGYATVVTDAAPPTDRWARGLLSQPVFPVLIATKDCP